MSRPWAHPRSRRENMMRRRVPANGPGSSPLTPGKRQQLARRLEDQGLIPAHAGKTMGRHRGRLERRDHPRSRGENYVRREPMQPHQGSSPLTRGKLPGGWPGERSPGIIPAPAGKTSSARSWPASRPAHPRSRGENFAAVWGTLRDWGSSPLAQGKPPGNGRRNRRGRAHPHSRRENVA